MMQYTTQSTQATQRLGEALGRTLQAGQVVAFFGDMGAGKTAFITGIARAFGVEDAVSSPTFALMHEYPASVPLYHFDMYRISSWEDLYSTGYFDYLDQQNAILLIEWSENIVDFLPEDCITVRIQAIGGTDIRKIMISGVEFLAYPGD